MRTILRAAPTAAALILLAVLIVEPFSAGAQTTHAQADLRDTSGNQVGTVMFTQETGEVLVEATVNDLPPDFHGFHIHSVGVCRAGDGFTSAGGHYNPTGNVHGDHAGDMPVLLVQNDGTGDLTFTTDRFMVAELFDPDRSAVIVHELADNYANIPTRYHSHTYDTLGPDQDTLATGDAGSRLACGRITRTR